MKKITAGRDVLGEFAPKFAQLNDDVLFGEVWSRESELSARDRSLITVTALMAQGLTDTSFGHHLAMAKENGITRSEIAEILTHAAFYAGWPKAWAAFRMAKDIWADAENTDEKQLHQNSMVFPIGAPNDGFAQYFSGQSYLAPVSTEQVKIFNVTFEPGCRSHGNYPEGYVPEFDFERLKEIKEKTKMPLVLHGGSGSGDENIKRCVEFGINKINVGCDFMNANVDSIKQHLKKDPDINYWVMMHQVEIDSQELVKKYIHLSGSEGKSL